MQPKKEKEKKKKKKRRCHEIQRQTKEMWQQNAAWDLGFYFAVKYTIGPTDKICIMFVDERIIFYQCPFLGFDDYTVVM